MARPTTATKAGRGTCPQSFCREPVTFKRTAGGMVTYACDCCDSTGYAPPESAAAKNWLGTIKAPAAAAPAAPAARAAAPAANDPAAAAPPRAAGGFSLGNL